jgi:succinate dehydrogenase hydrophobic anchor subunit
MLGELAQEQIQQSFLSISLPAVIVVLLVLGFVSLALLWRKGKTAEGLSLLNTVLLAIIILLLIFPIHT